MLQVYCLLANRVQFLREQATVHHQSVSVARATLCEVLAIRILRKLHESSPGPEGLLVLANILVEGFDPFQGAPSHVAGSSRPVQWPVQDRGGHERRVPALELAILSESKRFTSSQACQRVIDAIYVGRIIYTSSSFMDILPDHYKHRPVSVYNPSTAPFLNQYRLIVPRTRNLIELVQFLVLVTLYTLAMLHRSNATPSVYEVGFVVYTAGWILDEFAAIIEHGWEVHSQNLWSFLDFTFSIIFGLYLLARVYDVLVGQVSDGAGFATLCLAAPVLLTRIAFNLMPENIVFISLHAMMKDFLMLTFLAGWCFAGFFLALQWLVTSDNTTETPKWYTIVKWLIWIWFGLDGTGIEQSVQFHLILGPALMIAFSFLGNTLFLTILVALLTNTFSRIVAAEADEVQFRKAVLTFAGVKSDAIFAYPPPFNMAALAILLPLKAVVSPRTFHKIHVTLVRSVNAPTLVLISLFERWSLRRSRVPPGGSDSFWQWRFTGWYPHGDIQAVFEVDTPSHINHEADIIATSTPWAAISLHDLLSPPTRRSGRIRYFEKNLCH
ncbi:hypothetical protein CC79DRAFT_1344370 [Sarocladium strictum]